MKTILQILMVGLGITGITFIFQGEFMNAVFSFIGSFVVGTIGGLIYTPPR